MEKFKLLRDRLGLSQQELAKEMGCTQGAIWSYEHGRNQLKPNIASLLIDVAKKYGHKITYNDIYD